MGVHSWFGSLLDYCWCNGMLVIFAQWFCILRLWWSCLSVQEVFQLIRWGFLNRKSSHLQTETSWLSLFLFEYPLFLSIAWLPWRELPILCWIEVVTEGFLVLYQFSIEMLPAFAYSLWYWLYEIALIILRYVPSISSLLRVFNRKGCWILSEAFLHVSK